MLNDYLSYGAAAAVMGATVYANLPLQLIIPSDTPSIKELAESNLVKVVNEKTFNQNKQVIAKEIFKNGSVLIWAVRNPECPFCHEEAKDLALIEDTIKAAGVQIVAVVDRINGIDKFKKFFDGDIYYDLQHNFYGPKNRWIYYWLRFLRIKSYFDALRYGKTVRQFEGRIAGGVYLISKNKLTFCHLEKSWVDATDKNDIINAIKNI